MIFFRKNVTVIVLQPLILLLGYLDCCAVARGEYSLCFGFAHQLEVFPVGSLTELIPAVLETVIHKYPSRTVNERESARAFRRQLVRLHPSRHESPRFGRVKVGKRILLAHESLTAAPRVEEQMVRAFLVPHYVCVYRRVLICKERLWIILQTGKIGIGIGVIYGILGVWAGLLGVQ